MNQGWPMLDAPPGTLTLNTITVKLHVIQHQLSFAHQQTGKSTGLW